MSDCALFQGILSDAGWATLAVLAVAVVLPTVAVSAEEGTKLLSLNSADGVRETYGGRDVPRRLETVKGKDNTTDGDGALHLSGTSATREGNHYLGIMVPLPGPTDLREVQLLLDARTSEPKATKAFYVRCYNQGESKPAWSFNSWDGQLKREWRTFSMQTGLGLTGLNWEANRVGNRIPDRIDRIEFIIGTGEDNAPIDVIVDNLRTAPRVQTLQDLARPKRLVRTTVVIRRGKPKAIVLYPDSIAGKQAGTAVVRAVKERTGVSLPARAATEKDRQPDQTAILVGDVNSNPAILLLYARYLTPVDYVCPGKGGFLVHTVFDPFGNGVNAVVVGASDEEGIEKAADVFCGIVRKLAKGRDLTLPRILERGYSAEFLKRFPWAGGKPSSKRLQEGLATGQKALDTGRHTSIAGVLRTVASRYQLTGHSVEAKLFVQLWEMYAKSAVADPRKFGGPWGFDSDFPSGQVVPGWDVIEHDPSLTGEERLRVTKAMARWLAEAVIPKCAGAARSKRVPHNHQTFPGLGALYAGLYFTQGYDVLEGREWLGIADAMFKRQAGYFKPYEDCNGYQWLTNGHLMRYALARPDFTVFENGNARKIVDYCIGTMNNLGYQVPYGDTGSWRCWNSEMICLDAFAFATGDDAAAWAADFKRRVKGTRELYAFYSPSEGKQPDNFNGVRVWPLEHQYFESFRDKTAPPFERCFDKISFRETLEPSGAYLLLDGLSNGGHKHLDGNSVPQLVQYNRIWLADNDYYKAPVKFHNSVMVFKDGQSSLIPEYVELVGAGESERYGYCRTRLSNYAGIDWERTVVWLKWLKAFAVIDRLTARTSDEYQFRVLWHGVGDVQRSEQGMLLSQKGPSMWVQVGAGPGLHVVDDPELGKNWSGYRYADPMVHSLSGIATVRLKQGESYVFATAIHGRSEGSAEPWDMKHTANVDGMLLSTEQGDVGIMLGPVRKGMVSGRFSADTDVMVVDAAGVSLLGAKQARSAGRQVHTSTSPQSLDLLKSRVPFSTSRIKVRKPVANLAIGGRAPEHPVVWKQRPSPRYVVLTGNRGVPGAVNMGIKLRSRPSPAQKNVFNQAAPNTADALLDGQWGNSTETSVMYEPGRTVNLTLDLGARCRIHRVRWMQWWATTSSKKTSYLLQKVTVAVSNDEFTGDTRSLGTVTDKGPHPNFGMPLEYQVDGGDQSARWIRLTLEPKRGSAIYLAQVLVEGDPGGDAVDVAPFHFTRLTTGRLSSTRGLSEVLATTTEGTLFALNGEGGTRWQVDFPCRLNDVATADLDGDGKDEIIVARQDFRVSVLDCNGKEMWNRELKFYRRPPHVNVVRTGDLDGDGRPEVIVGGENWRFYAFKADGTELWHYESVHPSRSGAVADLDGDGKDEVVCGTHYYWMSTLNPDGTRRWRYNFGPICHDVTTGSFDGNKTRGVVYGGGDGCLHYLSYDGKLRLKYNTGDDVKQVATADLDGDGRDEILAGSMNHNIYCFGADGKRRWRFDIGAPVSCMTTVSSKRTVFVVAGSSAGRLVTLDSRGRLVASSDLGAALIDLVPHHGAAVAAVADGRLVRIRVKP